MIITVTVHIQYNFMFVVPDQSCPIVHIIKVAFVFNQFIDMLSPFGPIYHRDFLSSVKPLKLRHIHDLCNTDTSLIRTLCSVPSVSVLERFNCIHYICLSHISMYKPKALIPLVDAMYYFTVYIRTLLTTVLLNSL